MRHRIAQSQMPISLEDCKSTREPLYSLTIVYIWPQFELILFSLQTRKGERMYCMSETSSGATAMSSCICPALLPKCNLITHLYNIFAIFQIGYNESSFLSSVINPTVTVLKCLSDHLWSCTKSIF